MLSQQVSTVVSAEVASKYPIADSVVDRKTATVVNDPTAISELTTAIRNVVMSKALREDIAFAGKTLNDVLEQELDDSDALVNIFGGGELFLNIDQRMQ